MAIKHLSTSLCDSIIHHADGRVSLIGLFRNVSSPTLPFGKRCWVHVEIVSDVRSPFRVTVEGEDFTLLLAEGMLEKPNIELGNRQWAAVVGGELGLQFTKEGVFNVKLYSGEAVVHTTAFGVILEVPPVEMMEPSNDL